MATFFCFLRWILLGIPSTFKSKLNLMKIFFVLFMMILSFAGFSQKPSLNGTMEMGWSNPNPKNVPVGGVGVLYKYKFLTADAGIISHGNEYYSHIYLDLGIETKGRLFLGVNAGEGFMINIPQLDRHVVTPGDTVIIRHGYDSKTVMVARINAKLGYYITNEAAVYLSASQNFGQLYGIRQNWYTLGFRWSFKN